MERVLQGEPWWFDKKVPCLKPISGNEQPSEIKLTATPFWVWVYGLPFNQRTCEVACALAKKMGEYMEWDSTKE